MSDRRASGAIRNEDKPDPCEVERNAGNRQRKNDEMNKKFGQSLKKGTEMAMPILTKVKRIASLGYSKGNELMDKMPFLRKPLHKNIVWCTLGLVILWVLFPFGSNCSEVKGGKGGKLVFTESDFKKESSSEKMFYVKDGKDDGYKKVVPNLKRLPKSLSLENLCGSFNPELESSRRQKGMAYLNQEDGFYHCVVVHVGNGYVIAEPDSKTMYGNFCGYIETDDDHVEGQRLKTGFYAFTGQKKVPLANGSSRTMYSFARLDDKSNKLAINAVIWNVEATQAAEKENDRRNEAKRKAEEIAKDDIIDKALAKEAQRFKVRPIAEQIHLPARLKAKSASFAIGLGLSKPIPPIKEVQTLFESKKWRELVKYAGYPNNGSPEEIAKYIVDLFLSWERNVACSDKALIALIDKYVFVSVVPGRDKAEKKQIDSYELDVEGGFSMYIMLCEDVYMVDRSDEELLALLDAPEIFVEGFNEKYGK